MVTRITHTLVDDVDNTEEANQTVSFALDGTAYEIDLTDERAKALRSSFEEWTEYARVTTAAVAAAGTKRRSRSTVDHDPVQVREWAKTQGIEISERGRISSEILTAYKAHRNQ